MLLKFLRKFFNRLARYYSLGQSLSGGFFFGGERKDLRKLLDKFKRLASVEASWFLLLFYGVIPLDE